MEKEIKEFNEEKYVEMLEDGTLYDYITNLQEENEMYKKELEKADSITQSCIFEGSRSAGKSYRQCLNWLEDYKLRCEKAIEYIKRHIQKYDIDGSVGEFDEFEILASPKKLLSILNGGENND